MGPAEDTRSKRAEEFLWNHYRRALERNGQAEAALELRHHLMARQTGVSERDGFTSVTFDVHLRTSEFSVKLNAEDGETLGWYFDLLAEDSNDTLPAAEAQRAAETAAQPPPDAVLAYARYEDVAGRSVFVAHWGRVVDGVPVERDYIHAYVNGRTGRVFGVFRKWHDITYTFGAR